MTSLAASSDPVGVDPGAGRHGDEDRGPGWTRRVGLALHPEVPADQDDQADDDDGQGGDPPRVALLRAAGADAPRPPCRPVGSRPVRDGGVTRRRLRRRTAAGASVTVGGIDRTRHDDFRPSSQAMSITAAAVWSTTARWFRPLVPPAVRA